MRTLAALLVLCAGSALALPDSFDGKAGAGEVRALEVFSATKSGHPGRTSTNLLAGGPVLNAMATPDTLYNATGACQGQGSGTYGVCLEMKGAGIGHDHANTTPPIEFPDNDFCKSGIPLNTSVAWRFKTPPYAAQLALTWRWSGACTGAQTKTALSGLEGLSPLAAGSGYTLVGATAKHASNHFAAPETLSAVPLVAADYRKAFSNDPDLLVNDISLRYGGLFDISGDWSTPHVSHRFGNQVDIQKNTIPAGHQAKFEEFARNRGARVLIEGTHYHLDFTPANSPFFEETLRCDL